MVLNISLTLIIITYEVHLHDKRRLVIYFSDAKVKDNDFTTEKQKSKDDQ